MPRGARRKSGSNVYHVMLRGNGQRQIFQDEEDNEQFLEVLRHYKDECGYRVYAYCLMGNHVHLLLRVGEEGEDLGLIFRRIGAKYVYWYNGKYRRVGHLFQDRYKSEVVEDDPYLLTVLRYIHQNPVKAGMVSDVSEYKHSSYTAYVDPKPGGVVDVDFILDMMGEERFIEFHARKNEDKCLDMRPVQTRRTMSDEQARTIIAKVAKCRTVEAFQEKPRDERIKLLKILARKGLSYRQISRLTGESYGFVERAVKEIGS